MNKIKQRIRKLLFQYQRLSILKKFLLAPIFGIVLVLPFYVFIFLSMLEMKYSAESVNSELIPIYEISHENILLLENIVNEMNSAVLAKEIAWVEASNKRADTIKENLNKYIGTSYKKELKKSLKAFETYYLEVKKVSKKMIQTSHNYKEIEDDTKKLIDNYTETNMLFKDLKLKVKNEIEKNFSSLYDNTNFIFLKGNEIFFIWFLTSSFIIFLVHRDIKHRIKSIVESSKEIAKGDVDFEKRLCTVSYDELGEIVRSINIFINKLHKSHVQLSLAKKELDTLYITDRLTNVYNRVKIDEIIDMELKKQKRYDYVFSIILIDIDYFKLVNDTHGHLLGDLVLKEFAAILKENIRDTDFVGRWGGEEFIIVCPQTDEKGALALAEHLRNSIEASSFTAVEKKTASFGISTCQKNDDIASIIDNADKALYRAKNNGRNQVVYYKN
ncbi:MAG: diguanylate cyclase [Sulfurimonas sp.]|uniref:diguanylate cyclase n=1 Tax=Sulfurimonas sp. TaxID=2022749 RepID=UPI003D0E6013